MTRSRINHAQSYGKVPWYVPLKPLEPHVQPYTGKYCPDLAYSYCRRCSWGSVAIC